MKNSAPLGMLLIAGLLTACGGSDGPQRGTLREAPITVAALTTTQIDALTAANGLQPITGVARCDVRVVAIDYDTIGPKGERTNATGALLLPGGADPACNAPAPLLAIAKGTDVTRLDTVADPTSGYTALLTAMFAAQGYAVVVSDMLGYAGSSYPFHPYLHAESEATSMIDAIRAARRASTSLGAPLSERVMVSGYSQGGHTAAATQRAIERDLGTEINVVAAAYLSAPVDLVASVRSPDTVLGYQFFATLFVTGMQKVYGNLYSSPIEAFQLPYADWVENLLPADDFDQVMAEGKLPPFEAPAAARNLMMQPAYVLATQNDPDHPLVRAAERNSLMDWTPQAATVVCYGSEDPVVPPALHSIPLRQALLGRGVTNATFVDVDPFVRQSFGVNGAPPADAAAAQDYYINYHNSYVVPFCMAAARQLFNNVR